MNLTMLVNDDPNVTVTATVLFVVAGVIFTAGAALLYRPLFQKPFSPTGPDRPFEPDRADRGRMGSKEVVR